MNFKIAALFIVVFGFICGGFCAPADFNQPQSVENVAPFGVLTLPEDIMPQEEHHLRVRRATCDLLSVSTPWGSLNHAACAAHCLSMNRGFRGGYCSSKAVCTCRR